MERWRNEVEGMGYDGLPGLVHPVSSSNKKIKTMTNPSRPTLYQYSIGQAAPVPTMKPENVGPARVLIADLAADSQGNSDMFSP